MKPPSGMLRRSTPPGELGSHVPHALWVILDLVEAATRANHTAEARAHVAALTNAHVVEISPRLAAVTQAVAAMTAPGGDKRTEFQRALSVPDIERWPFDHARILLSYGEHLRRERATGEARVQLGRAVDGFRVLGARPWADKAASELRAAGATTGSSPTGTIADSLTPQQLEIAQLAAQGLTNKQIGERLFLSHRTVATHLYQLYPKLGITSRAALRDALAASGQQAPPAAVPHGH